VEALPECTWLFHTDIVKRAGVKTPAFFVAHLFYSSVFEITRDLPMSYERLIIFFSTYPLLYLTGCLFLDIFFFVYGYVRRGENLCRIGNSSPLCLVVIRSI